MDDESIMPFGKYYGLKMGEVPAGYLIYIYDEGYVSINKYNKVYHYILDNLDGLKMEIAEDTETEAMLKAATCDAEEAIENNLDWFEGYDSDYLNNPDNDDPDEGLMFPGYDFGEN